MVHCLGKKALFLLHIWLFIWWFFFPSNTPIMLYDIRYWWFFISQGNQWTKYLAHPKIRRPKPCILMFGSLIALDSFHLLLSTQLTAHLTLEWNGGSMFYPLSHIYAKTLFCCIETVANNALNCWHIVVFDRLWANTAPTLNTASSLTNVHSKWWIHCLLISSIPMLSHINFNSWSDKIFWRFPGQLPNLDDPSIHLHLYNHI